MSKQLCVLVRRAPYGTIHAAEGIRLALGGVSNGLQTALVLVDDGVYAGKDGQEVAETGWTALSGVLHQALATVKKEGPALEVYVHAPSLKERGLGAGELIPGAKVLDDAGLAVFLARSEKVAVF